jgi:hypothetical protein
MAPALAIPGHFFFVPFVPFVFFVDRAFPIVDVCNNSSLSPAAANIALPISGLIYNLNQFLTATPNLSATLEIFAA